MKRLLFINACVRAESRTRRLAEELLSQGILIRDCTNFSGLTEVFYRVAVRTHEENIRLITALRRCLNA